MVKVLFYHETIEMPKTPSIDGAYCDRHLAYEFHMVGSGPWLDLCERKGDNRSFVKEDYEKMEHELELPDNASDAEKKAALKFKDCIGRFFDKYGDSAEVTFDIWY